MRALPKEKYSELNELIRKIQDLYPVKRWQLADAYTKLEKWVEENSVFISMEDVREVGTFGLLAYSIMANAYDRKARTWLPYHGDIYCEIWRWDEKAGKLMNINAWGVIREKELATVHQPLIEFP